MRSRRGGARIVSARTSDRDVDLLDDLRGGTLLLDELGDLAPEAQAQVCQLDRRRAQRPAGADVRLVATTHRDLLAAVRAGRFRPDLYYALRRAVLSGPAAAGRGSTTCRSSSSTSGARSMPATASGSRA